MKLSLLGFVLGTISVPITFPIINKFFTKLVEFVRHKVITKYQRKDV